MVLACQRGPSKVEEDAGGPADVWMGYDADCGLGVDRHRAFRRLLGGALRVDG